MSEKENNILIKISSTIGRKMGSRPSKVAPMRSRSGLSFVSTSSMSSLNSNKTFDEVLDYAQNFVFDDVATRSFTVKWDPPEEMKASAYQVRLFPPDHIKSKTLVRALPEPQYKFKRLNPSTTYTVAVVAIDGNKKKGPCATGYVTTLPQPPRDINFSANGGSDALRVNWKHCKGKRGEYQIELLSKDDVTSPTRVERSKTTSHLFKGLLPGTEYEVTLVTVANGATSEPVSEKIQIEPRHVCDLTFNEVTQHELSLKWKKPKGQVDSYTIELTENKPNPGEQHRPIIIEKLTQTSYTFNGLTPGRLYCCKITSNAGEKSSKQQSFTQCTVPVETDGIRFRDVGPEEATVIWASAEGDVDDYDLFLTPKNGVIGETTPRGVTKTEYKFTGLVPGTVYTVGIVSNAEDKSSKRVVSIFATEPGMCGELEFPQADATCTTQLLKWPAATGSVDCYVINIRREDKQEAGWKIEEVYKTIYQLNNLTPGTMYRVHVAAMREGRESSSVNSCFGTIPVAVPSIFFPKDECSWNAITCSWEPSVGGVDSYHVEGKKEIGTSFETTVKAENADHIFTGLTPATVYEFSVTAVSNGVKSAPTKRKQTTGPGKVVSLRGQSTSKRQIVVNWNPPAYGADDYIIKLSSLEEDGGGLSFCQETSQTEYEFKALTPGSCYEVEVVPTFQKIKGEPSTTKVYTKPGDVMNINVPADAITLDSIRVQWWGVEGNCKDVDLILTRLKKNGDEDDLQKPTVVKEEHVSANDEGSSRFTFQSLEPDTIYGIRLRATGKAGIGKDAVITQATLAPIKEDPVIIDHEVKEKIPDTLSSVVEIKVESHNYLDEPEKEDVEEKTLEDSQTEESQSTLKEVENTGETNVAEEIESGINAEAVDIVTSTNNVAEAETNLEIKEETTNESSSLVETMSETQDYVDESPEKSQEVEDKDTQLVTTEELHPAEGDEEEKVATDETTKVAKEIETEAAIDPVLAQEINEAHSILQEDSACEENVEGKTVISATTDGHTLVANSLSENVAILEEKVSINEELSGKDLKNEESAVRFNIIPTIIINSEIDNANLSDQATNDLLTTQEIPSLSLPIVVEGSQQSEVKKESDDKAELNENVILLTSTLQPGVSKEGDCNNDAPSKEIVADADAIEVQQSQMEENLNDNENAESLVIPDVQQDLEKSKFGKETKINERSASGEEFADNLNNSASEIENKTTDNNMVDDKSEIVQAAINVDNTNATPTTVSASKHLQNHVATTAVEKEASAASYSTLHSENVTENGAELYERSITPEKRLSFLETITSQ